MTSSAMQQWATKQHEDVAYEVGYLKIELADDPSDEERAGERPRRRFRWPWQSRESGGAL